MQEWGELKLHAIIADCSIYCKYGWWTAQSANQDIRWLEKRSQYKLRPEHNIIGSQTAGSACTHVE